MSHHKLEFDTACRECKSTGLYVGVAEHDGAAVVCYRCKGTGKYRLIVEYDDFEKRSVRPEVRQVYQANPGIVIGLGANRQYSLEDFGGMPYQDWLKGHTFQPGTENRKFTCPAWWYQTADYTKKPEWKECTFGAFSSCSSFASKDRCWARWDAEHGRPSVPPVSGPGGATP